MARFKGVAYGTDTRPVKNDKVKEPPKGGWRTKSGVRKLGKVLEVEADDMNEAATKVAGVLGKMKPENLAKVVRVQIIAVAAAADAKGNPFEA